MAARRLGIAVFLAFLAVAGLFAGCGTATFTAQQYEGAPRARNAIAVIRVNGKESVVLDSLDGEDASVRVPEDARLHVEVLPGKHTVGVALGHDTSGPAHLVAFVAEAGKFYRPVFVQETRPNDYGARRESARIYEVDEASDALLRDVTQREAPPPSVLPPPRSLENPPEPAPEPVPVPDAAGVPAEAGAPAAAADAGTAAPEAAPAP